MRTTRLLASGTLTAVFAVATLALAQSRSTRSPRHSAKPKPAATAAADDPYSDKAPSAPPASSAAATTAPAASIESGPVPAPVSDVADGGGRLSPLNPAPSEFSDAGTLPPPLDYDRLLADIGALRARVAAVSDTLFHSRIAVTIETTDDHSPIASMSVSLDDGVVWTAPPTFRAEDETTIYDHAVAPGHHAVSVDVERRDDQSGAFRSTQRSRFVVDVPAGAKLAVELELWDDSNMGSDFPSDKSGRYDLRVRARVKARPLRQ